MGSTKSFQSVSIIVLGYFLLAFVTPARGINCYQCSSTDNKNPFQCNEFMNEDIDIEPIDCSNVWGAKYCVKHVGRFEGGVGTKRFCSSVHMGNDCHYTNTAGDDPKIKYRTCVYTCNSDGCNPATKKSANIFVIISLLIVPLVYLYQR